MALNATISNGFKNAFEQKCFQLMTAAYRCSLDNKMVELDWNENDISYVLYENIESNPERFRYKMHVASEVRFAKTEKKAKGFADKLPRIDLKMSHIRQNKEFKFFFEAKNLKENNIALKRRYISTGIDNFISKKYENGCLIGYLLQGDADKTVNGINSLLNKDKRNTEILTFRLNNLCNSYCESAHVDIGILKHFIFDFTPLTFVG